MFIPYMVEISLIILAMLYCIILTGLIWGIFRLKTGKNQKRYTVSVIVAARNEKDHIRPCLTSLISQTYPTDKIEIIIIDDRSTDNTAEIVRSYHNKGVAAIVSSYPLCCNFL